MRPCLTPHGVLQTVVERFNYEINMRVLVNVRRLIKFMEWHRLLAKEDLQHVHAFSSIVQPLCQYGLDLLMASWNEHGVRPRRRCGVPGDNSGLPTRRKPSSTANLHINLSVFGHQNDYYFLYIQVLAPVVCPMNACTALHTRGRRW